MLYCEHLKCTVMQVKTQPVKNAISAKEVVLSFIKALNDSDFDSAREYLDDNMIFQGVLGSRNSADDYIRDMKKMKFKYAIQKVFADGDDVCLWYDISMSGSEIFSSGWYKVEEGKIKLFKVIFDPRPVLEQAKK
jgi:limonene-1,2-epoxide hydrolase